MIANVAIPEDRDRIIIAADGGVDYLVNAAAIIKLKPIFDVTLQDMRDVYSVNVEGTLFLCSGIGPKIRPNGAIVNLSSSSAKLATTVEAAVYASTKTAVLSITRSFAYALAPRNVRVNAICPGIIDTPMQEKVLAEVALQRDTTPALLSEERNKSVPLGRSASADECAGAIWFLLSDDAGYMTGQAINYTGGLVMW